MTILHQKCRPCNQAIITIYDNNNSDRNFSMTTTKFNYLKYDPVLMKTQKQEQ